MAIDGRQQPERELGKDQRANVVGRGDSTFQQWYDGANAWAAITLVLPVRRGAGGLTQIFLRQANQSAFPIGPLAIESFYHERTFGADVVLE
jgi:hypothetical protein